ncbi:MAG: response regulator transcription factor [Gemmatirosa sp.]|nr:response regulator transcription factor [Gemmatirosa sp.]
MYAPSERDALARTRVLVIADVRLYRDGLADGLASHDRLAVLGAVRSGDEAMALLAATQPDVVVLDMAARDSLALVRAVRDTVPNAKTIAFAVEEVEHEILACVEAGVAGYVPCDGSLADVVAAIDSAMRDELVCSPRVAATLLRRATAVAAAPAASGLLTVREREIAGCIDRGFSNKEIARYLHIEVATVKNHVHSILDKLQVTTRAQAAAQLRAPTAARWRR